MAFQLVGPGVNAGTGQNMALQPTPGAGYGFSGAGQNVLPGGANAAPYYQSYQPYQPVQAPGAVAAPKAVTAADEAAYVQQLMSGLGISGPQDTRGAQQSAMYAAANPLFDAIGGARGGLGQSMQTRLVGEAIAAPTANIEMNYANALQNWNQNLLGMAQGYGNRATQAGQWGAQFEAGQNQWGADFQAGQNQMGYDYGMGEWDKMYERNMFNPWLLNQQAMMSMDPKNYNQFFGSGNISAAPYGSLG